MTIDLEQLTETSLSFALSENPIELDAQTVAALIAKLARARARMTPEVPTTWAGGRQVEAVVKPKVTIESEKLATFVLVHLRDPGLGWMHYAFSRDQALELAALLQKFASNLPVTPSPSRAN